MEEPVDDPAGSAKPCSTSTASNRGGVDLGLVSWVGDNNGELSATPSDKVGRCLCSAKETSGSVGSNKPAPSSNGGTVKKRAMVIDRPHIIPQVEVFSVPSVKQQAVATISQRQAHKVNSKAGAIEEPSLITGSTPAVVMPAATTTANHHKPILSRKNWNNTIDICGPSGSSSTQQQPPQSNLRRYGSQQSCKSASTLRSYLSSTSRGKSHHHRSSHDQPSHSEAEVGDDALSGGLNDEKIPGGPGLNERELWSLHRAVPGLRRHDPRTSTMRMHYYVEGGWGWLVVGAAFLVQVLTTGLQLAFGVMAPQIARHFKGTVTPALSGISINPETPANTNVIIPMEAVWIGVIQLSGSWLWAPLVVALCRRKSTRLTAVLGGLVLALSALFASFAQQLHQVFLSYGALMSIAMTLVRESSALMVGQYFKRRRDFVEIVVQMGAGIGVILFSVFFKEALGQLGWRLGLQAATGLLLSTFFLGTLYRSASLYHPQRRAILHLKTQRKKVKVKGKPSNDRPPYFDFSVLRLKSLRMILLSSGIGSIGAYTPLFYLALQGEEDGLESSDLLLIHTFLGLAMSAGTVIVGLVVLRPSPQCLISLQYLCQATLYGISISLLALATVNGYHGYVLFAWLYGFCLGGYHYALHQYTLDRVRARQFARGWSLVLAIRALPTLFGVPIAGYINQSTPRAGYYFSFTFTVIGASLLFLSKMYRRSAPPNLFLGGGSGGRGRRGSSSPRSSGSFQRRSAGGGTIESSSGRDKSSQEPLVMSFRPGMEQSSNGGILPVTPNPIRTVHQDVCTCPHPPPMLALPQLPMDDVEEDLPSDVKSSKNIGKRIVQKLASIPWKNNPLTEFFSSAEHEPDNHDPAMINKDPGSGSGACNNATGAVVGIYNPYHQEDVDWDEYWNNEGCLGGCDQMDCEFCQQCADCGEGFDEDEAVLDYEDQQQQQQHIRHHHGMLPDAVDIPELPPEVKRYHHNAKEVRRSMREMSFSDPEHLQRIGITCPPSFQVVQDRYSQHQHIRHPHVTYDQQGAASGIPRLPPKLLLRRQHTWHDVSTLTRDVDVIEQITTSV